MKRWIAGVALMAALGMAAPALARCDLTGAESTVYGYQVGTQGNCTTLEEAEALLRSGSGGLPAVQLAFIIPYDFDNGPSSRALLDYRPYGALKPGASALTGAPVSTTSFFRTYAKNWPPAPGSCPLAGCDSTGCATPELERQRLQCQIAATWSQDPRYCWNLSGNVSSSGAVTRFSRANGAGNESGSLLFAPSSSTANDSGATLSATLQTCVAGRDAETPAATQSFSWGMARQDTISCGAGSTVNGAATSAGDACSTRFEKAIVNGPKFTQAPNQCSAGNPCYPGNGNKTADVKVFDYGRIALSLHYGSLRQLRNFGYIDQNWSHSFAKRILTEWGAPGHFGTNPENAPIENVATVFVQDEMPALEVYRRDGVLPAGQFRATSSLGRTVRYFGQEGATAPRYELTYTDGQVEIYDRAGRLLEMRRAGSPAGNLVLTYRGRAITQSHQTETAHLEEAFWRIDRITDGSGRYVTFHYGSGRLMPLARIVADDGITELARFDHDPSGRLSALVRFGESQQFLYNEPAYLDVAAGVRGAWLTGVIDEEQRRYATYAYDDWGRAKASWHGLDAGKVEIVYPTVTPGGTAQDDSRAIVRTPAYGEVEYRFHPTEPYRQLSSVVDMAGTVSYEFQPSGHRVKARIDRRGIRTEFDYNPANSHQVARVEAKGTPDQRRTEFDWDYSTGRMTGERLYAEPSNGPRKLLLDRRFRYVPGTALLAGTDRVDPLDGRSRSTSYTYCTSTDVVNPATGCALTGQLKSFDGPRTDVADTVSYAYYTVDALGGCGSLAGPCQRKGDLRRITNALGQSSEIVTYDRAGRPLRVRDENGTLTDYSYHARGWLLTRTVRATASGVPSATDATTTLEYDRSGNVTRQIAPDNAGTLSYSYDDAQRLVRIGDALGNALTYDLDRSGNRRSERRSGPDGIDTHSLYRNYNQLNQLVFELDAFSRPLYHMNLNDTPAGVMDGHDANGNPRRLIDGRAVLLDMQYDALNRLVKTLQDYQGSGPTANAETRYGYDAEDRLTSVTDADGVPTGYHHNGLGDLRQVVSRDSGTSTYTYDLAGNKITETDARGTTATHVYDALNRVTDTFYPDLSRHVRRDYDLADSASGCVDSYSTGRLSRITDRSGSTTYCHDRRGNVVRKIRLKPGQTLLSGDMRQVHYAYDKSNLLRQIVYPHGSVVSYARNANGQATGLSWQPYAGGPVSQLVLNAQYYPFGPLHALTFGNTLQLVKNYDANYMIDSIESTQPGGLVLDLQTDVLGNVMAIAPSIDGPPLRRYSYDPLNRLTEMRDGSNVMLEQFGYTAVGDRLSKRIGAQSPQNYSYQPGTHRLASSGSVGRSYDANGNTTGGLDFSSYPLVYDDANRLSQVTAPGQGASVGVNYDYDGLGQRVSKARGDELVDTFYDESGSRLVDEVWSVDCSGSVSRKTAGTGHVASAIGCPGGGTAIVAAKSRTEYLYLDGLPVVLARYSGSNPTVQLSYLHTDHLGTPRVAINVGSGAQQWRWDLQNTAFGDHAPVALESGYELNMRYPGQFYDKESGLYHNYFRDYEPKTGRYIESDPIGLAGGLATYSYVSGNPLSLFDFLGLIEGSQGNLDRRRRIDEIAKSYEGSPLWAKNVRKGDHPPGSNKCNLFVNDVLAEADAPMVVRTKEGNTRRPTAGEMANTGAPIPNWRVLKPSELPGPGDVAAFRLDDGLSTVGATGHTGIITSCECDAGISNQSAHEFNVGPVPGQFNNKTFRRYTGD